jgi:hypothetical protein
MPTGVRGQDRAARRRNGGFVRNPSLHRRLEVFAVDASSRLSAETAAGAEMPFELIEERGGGRVPLYCYRELTGEFVVDRMGILSTLPSFEEAIHGLSQSPALEIYLSEHGEARIPSDGRGRAQAALGVFLASVFSDRSGFGFEPARFEAAYSDLERALYEGHCTTTVIAPLLGVALAADTTEIQLGDGLSMIRGDALPGAPVEAIWNESDEPCVLALLAIDQTDSDRSPVAIARTRFRRLLSALRLFERGGYAVGPVGWARTDAGGWRTVSIGVSGRPRLETTVAGEAEEELRTFYRLASRQAPAGELSWALARYEMGCERLAPFEALTDYLLALRAMLEPEGPASGRLAQRLAVICGRPEDRAALAQRTARAVMLERSIVTGVAIRDTGVDQLVGELAEHLRAILRDTLCGHLDPDLCAVADELLAESATDPVAAGSR